MIGMIQKNTQRMTSGYDQIIWNALTPIDATHTRHFNLHFQKFSARSPKHDDDMIKTIAWGLDEDARVIEHVKPPLTPASADGRVVGCERRAGESLPGEGCPVERAVRPDRRAACAT